MIELLKENHKINKDTNKMHSCINRESWGIITDFLMLLLNRQLLLIIKIKLHKPLVLHRSFFNERFSSKSSLQALTVYFRYNLSQPSGRILPLSLTLLNIIYLFDISFIAKSIFLYH